MFKIILKNLLALALILTIVLGPMLADLASVAKLTLEYKSALAGNRKIRQEINIIDSNMVAASNAIATSSAIVNLDSTQYTSGTYYFEVVASTTSATNKTVSLSNATSGVPYTTVTVNGTTNARYRSSSFTAPVAATDCVIVVGSPGENVGVGVLEARIIILQSASSITKTETQIEIGNEELYTSSATSTFANPKYWLYDASKWDGTTAFYAEVTFMTLAGFASSTSYTVAGTKTVVIPANTASTSIELWGGSGAGAGTTTTTTGGLSGGGGGAYAKSYIAQLTGSHTLVIAAVATGGKTVPTASGGDATWDTTVVVAKGGAGATGTSTNAAGGLASASTGQIKFNGGNGGKGGSVSQGSGGGGGGAGDAGDGGAGGNGSAGPTAGAAGTAGTAGGGAGALGKAAESDGAAGTAPGGGGSGAYLPDASDHNGGDGALGKMIITDFVATTTISLQQSDGTGDNFNFAFKSIINGSAPAATSTRIRVSFSPQDGRNYRIAFSNGRNTVVHAIYNAKIIVDQTNPTLLETEYMIANTKFAAGTALQKFLTYFDPAEWNSPTLNVYKHEANSLVSGTSDVKLQDSSGSPDVTGSTITDVIQREQSAAMTMPAASALGVIATSNVEALNNSVILAQVNTAMVPDAPTSLTATAGNGQVKLTWTAPADTGGSTLLNYEVVRNTSTGPTTPTNHLATTTASVTTYYDYSGANDTTYYYRVVVGNAVGTSTYSNEASTAPTEPSVSATRDAILFLAGRLKFLGGRIRFF